MKIVMVMSVTGGGLSPSLGCSVSIVTLKVEQNTNALLVFWIECSKPTSLAESRAKGRDYRRQWERRG